MQTRAGMGSWIAALALGVSSGASAQHTPQGWRWVTDRPAAGAELSFITMAPGWHITTKPGTLLFHPGFEGRGRYSVEAEIFLFPGDNQEEYGLFIGGSDLEGPRGSYTAFV